MSTNERNYTPGEREVMGFVIDLWKKDPSTEQLGYAKLLARVKKENETWAISEKRLKTILKAFNLQPNTELYTYIKDTTTEIDPESIVKMMPRAVKLQMTKSRGKGLYAVRDIKAGTKIWSEIAVVQTPPPELLGIMRSGNACAFCGTSLRTAEGQLLTRSAGVSCTICPANWCTAECKRQNKFHPDTCHSTFRNKINTSAWKEYEMFCTENNWKAGLLFGIASIAKIKNDPHVDIAGFLNSLATVRQDIRQKAVSQTNSLDYENMEQMWKQGHEILNRVLGSLQKLSYDEYLKGIGMVNINNLDGAIFLTHSHLNHSCSPNVNAEIHSRAEGITVVAKSDIQSGRELTVSYVDPSLSYEERQYKLRINWGFICSCERCKNEKENPPKAENSNEVEGASQTRKRSKSVRFEQNPVTSCVEIPAN